MYNIVAISKKTLRKCIKLLCIVIIFIILPINSYSQNTDTLRLINPISIDIINVIPPLSVLIDSALNSAPLLKAKEANLAIKKAAITTTKRSLLKNVGFQTYYNYGNTDVYSLSNSSSSVNTLLNSASQSITSYYGIGASIRLSIFDLLEYKGSIKSDKINYEGLYYEKENEKLQIRKQIITQYYEIILLQKKLKISHQALIDAQTQADMAEKEFSQGEIDLKGLASFRDMKLNSQIQVDTYWSQFMTAYALLQESTGIRFSNLKIIE